MPIQHLIRAAVAGMLAHRTQVEVVSHNLANINTAGFKANRIRFLDVLYDRHKLATDNEDLRIGAGARPSPLARIYTQGVPQHSESPTDLAIFGEGWFQLQQPNGEIAYTRHGAFRVDADGRLVGMNGLPLAPSITVPPGGLSSLEIDVDGRVSYRPEDGVERVELGQVQLARFLNIDGLLGIGDSLYVATPESGPPEVGLPDTAGFGRTMRHALESSNVNPTEEITNMLIAQRAYSLSVRTLQTLDEMIGMANNLRR